MWSRRDSLSPVIFELENICAMVCICVGILRGEICLHSVPSRLPMMHITVGLNPYSVSELISYSSFMERFAVLVGDFVFNYLNIY